MFASTVYWPDNHKKYAEMQSQSQQRKQRSSKRYFSNAERCQTDVNSPSNAQKLSIHSFNFNPVSLSRLKPFPVSLLWLLENRFWRSLYSSFVHVKPSIEKFVQTSKQITDSNLAKSELHHLFYWYFSEVFIILILHEHLLTVAFAFTLIAMGKYPFKADNKHLKKISKYDKRFYCWIW